MDPNLGLYWLQKGDLPEGKVGQVKWVVGGVYGEMAKSEISHWHVLNFIKTNRLFFPVCQTF